MQILTLDRERKNLDAYVASKEESFKKALTERGFLRPGDGPDTPTGAGRISACRQYEWHRYVGGRGCRSYTSEVLSVPTVY